MFQLVNNMLTNTSLELIDFSDNDLTDLHGEYITTLMKTQSEMRDNEIWQNSLRQATAEDYLNYCVTELNALRSDYSTKQEIDSTLNIKRMLDNLDNHEMQTPAMILDQQAHLLNFKKQRIIH